MTDEDAFLRAILNSQNDLFPQLVFADWLEELGDPDDNNRSILFRYLRNGGDQATFAINL